MIYELRVYHAVPGRLPDLLKRFDSITLKIWQRHGIEQAGFWTTLVGDSNQALYYLLKWESLDDREKKWNAFQADPEWHRQRAETEANGPIVQRVANSFLAPTSFSSVKYPNSEVPNAPWPGLSRPPTSLIAAVFKTWVPGTRPGTGI